MQGRSTILDRGQHKQEAAKALTGADSDTEDGKVSNDNTGSDLDDGAKMTGEWATDRLAVLLL